MDIKSVVTPELQKAMASFINKLTSYTSQGIDWAKVEVPAVIKEYIGLLFIENIVWLIFNLIIIIAFSIIFYKVIKFIKTLDSEERYFGIGMGTFIYCFLMSFPLIHMVNETIICLQIYFAPKAFLIKYIIETFK